MADLAGVCVPVCTVFSEDGAEVNKGAFLEQIDYLLDAGVHIIALAGGTGEFPFLSEREKRRLAELAGPHIKSRRSDTGAKVIIQSSAIRTEDTIEASKHAVDCGADCLLVLPPYFEGPGEDGVLWHFEQVAKAVNCDIMAYNIPQFSGFDITPATFAKLRQLGQIAYIKDSMGDMLRLEQLVASGAKVFNGCDYLNPYAHLAGCIGFFSGSGNFMAKALVQLYGLLSSGDHQNAMELWKKLKPASRVIWEQPFNPSVKAAAVLAGRPVGHCRKPVLPLSTEEQETLRAALSPLIGEC
ncbi:MAG: dihydrodipicolinate synthase family protein [Kiloniellales bacterium]|nr:dihydrodipicolinate synthase family protein [Kiloniellales bacterium]